MLIKKGASHKCFTLMHSGKKKVFAVYIIHASAIVWLLFANALGCLHTRSFEQFVLLVCAARRMISDRWPVCSAGVFFSFFFSNASTQATTGISTRVLQEGISPSCFEFCE